MALSSCAKNCGAPGMIRTCDTGFRRAVLYPLSYGGNALEAYLPGRADL
jgi:hypothetical protein